MSWLEAEEIEAFQKRDADNGLKASSDVALVIELARRLGLKETTDFYTGEDSFKLLSGILGLGDCGVRFGCGVGYDGFSVDFYFDEDGKLAAHGVWE